jgi:phosphonate transport system permease protein
MIPPNFERWQLLLNNLLETLEIAVIASAFGVALSLPIGLAASRNLMPTWATWPARIVIADLPLLPPGHLRHPLCEGGGVRAAGGHPDPGFRVHRVHRQAFRRGHRGDFPQAGGGLPGCRGPVHERHLFAVLPQVLNRFIGFATYQFDANIRNSTMVGIVGAGGIGGTLFAAFQRFDYDFLAAILISIIALVMLGEYLASIVKAVFND